MYVKQTRRSFVKTSLATASATLLAGTSAFATEVDKEMPKWNEEADIVILGYGNAGSNAAIAAKDGGVSVVILEKMPIGGGNVSVSSGGFVVPTDRAEYYEYQKALYELSRSEWSPEILEVFCDESMKLGDYVQTLAPEGKLVVYGHAGYQSLPGADCVNKVAITKVPGATGGDRLFGVFSRAVDERKIPIHYSTPAKRLITKDGEVIGVEAEKDGQPFYVKANKAVIICTGGFQCNPLLMSRYIYGNPMAYLGSPGNTGDGLLMAQAAGCDLWHMNSVSAPLGIQIPGIKAAIAIVNRHPSFIWVDQDGKRFVNEKALDYHCSWTAVNNFDAIQHRYPRIPCYMIFDATYYDAGPLVTKDASGYATNREGYKWSADNSKELAEGIIVKGDTLQELAGKIGIKNPENLENTVQRWNRDLTQEGIDTEFGRTLTADSNMKAVFIGRDVKSWSAPLDQAPFYAVKLVPVVYHTMGGPKKSTKAEVLAPDGQPIPRLYVAGELGSTWGLTYQGACANADAMIFGRIAGREAAKLDNWK